MKKITKKFAVLTAAFAIFMAMSVSSFAAASLNGGVYEGNDATLNIEKTVKVSNPSLTKVAGPGLQLAYTVAPATVAATTQVSDGAHGATVHAGPADGLTLTSAPEFTKAELLNASAAGEANVKNIVLGCDITKFTAPGIFRYELKDTTTSEALSAAGVERSDDFDDTRFVDVYIVRNANDQLEIGGYVVGSDDNNDGNLQKETFDTSTKETTDDNDTPNDPSDDTVTTEVKQTPDVFTTYNIVLEKEVTGSMGDRNHQFQFAMTLSQNNGNGLGRAFYAQKEGSISGTQPNQTADTTSLSATLAHGEKYQIAGLTINDKIAYEETNNTSDTYKVSINGEDSGDVAPGASKAMSPASVANAASTKFTNNLDSVSPTGVVMRFGAPLLVLAAAVAMFVLSRKAKKESSTQA